MFYNVIHYNVLYIYINYRHTLYIDKFIWTVTIRYCCQLSIPLYNALLSIGKLSSEDSNIVPIILLKCFIQHLRGYCTSGPYFRKVYAFSQKIKQLWTKYPMDLVRNVPRNSKITVLLQQRPLLWSYSEKCAKINIFHVLSHKSITTWVSEFPVQRFPGMLRNISYLLPMCCSFWEKCINSQKTGRCAVPP